MSASPVKGAPTRLRPGQVWSLADERYPTAQVIIGRLEKVGPDEVVHVSVLGVPVTKPDGGLKLIVFGHMPFTEEAVRRSVGRRIKARGPLYSGFEEGYSEWRRAKGGVFILSIGDAIEVGLKTMSQPLETVEQT